MARARNIKPGFFRNADLVELPVETRLLFPGLWVLADRAGRLEDRPKQIKMEIFPADAFDVDVMLNQLQDSGLIIRYVVDEKKYIQVINFEKHQNPHRDEKRSTIPAPCQHGANTVFGCGMHQPNPADSLIPDSLIPDSSTKNIVDSPVAVDPTTDEFEEAWALYPQRPGRSKADALRAWKARIKEGIAASLMIKGVCRYAEYCRKTGTEPQYIKQPATFFGPGHHYLSDWMVPDSRASPLQARDEGRRRVIEELCGGGSRNGSRNDERRERDITDEIVRLAE